MSEERNLLLFQRLKRLEEAFLHFLVSADMKSEGSQAGSRNGSLLVAGPLPMDSESLYFISLALVGGQFFKE